jgi:hypothetical protein
VLVAAARAPRLRGGSGHVLGTRPAHAWHCSVAASLKLAPPWLWYSGMLGGTPARVFQARNHGAHGSRRTGSRNHDWS